MHFSRFTWKQTSFMLGQSTMQVFWEIDKNVPAATYRIRHFGAWKRFWGKTSSYIGTSRSFLVKE